MTLAINTGLVLEQYISFQLSSVACQGLHDKTQVTMKLQNISQSTKASKKLGDHTHHIFDFTTTVHNMTFDILKIDVYDYKKAAFGQNAKIGRAYLPLRELQKMVGNKYDNDGNDNTEPEQSVLSTRFDAAAFCQKHDDVFKMDLPLYKHGSYSVFGSSRHHNHHHHSEDEHVVCTKGSETGQDVAVPPVRRRPVRSDSFAQNAMNGVEVGMVTIQAILHFKDQTKNPAFAHLGKGPAQQQQQQQQQQQVAAILSNASISDSSYQGGLQRSLSRKSKSNQSLDSTHSNDSSTLGVNHDSCGTPTSDTFSPEGIRNSITSSVESPYISSLPRPILIDGPSRILLTPSSPPNLSLHRNGGENTAGSSNSPPLSPTFSQSPGSPPETSFQWLTDNNFPQATTIPNWDELHHGDGFVDDGDDDELNNQQQKQNGGQEVKGENLTQSDRDKEEEMMANIMANGDQAKKELFLRNSQAALAKSKKTKINFFSDQTRSAFKDIQLMYSSFFGHGWNLSRSEFWRGFHIVQQFYARHPTPTTNKAFDDIEILEHARHFVRLAIASYGSLPWVYFGYSFKVAPLNFVRFNSDRKNVQDYFKLKKEDMIVWHFDKRTALVPSYYIVRDPKYNALCIIIRGTFSITDAMTDLVCEYYPYKGGLVHKGIMDNARFVLERSGKDIETALRKFNLKTIFCIGHSLGAGSASLLCSLLQDHFADYLTTPTPQLPTPVKLEVKAYLFAPPPIATPNLAEQWERTQISFINENDIVCRLSYGNALDLKELIKIGAIESLNPAYEGLSAEEKLDEILKVLGKAQKRLQAVNDVPRLVTAGTVTYLHKIYEDTPVVKNKKGKGQRNSQFGLPDNWTPDKSDNSNSNLQVAHGGGGGGRARGASFSSTTSNNPLTRSLSVLTSALSLKGGHHGHGHGQAQHQRQNTASTLGSGSTRTTPIVTPYQAGQPAIRLESSVSLALSDLNERHKELSQPQSQLQQPISLPVENGSAESQRVPASFGAPVHYEGTSEERTQATESILQQSREAHQPSQSQQDQTSHVSATPISPSTSEFDSDLPLDNESDLLDGSEDSRIYTTTKPKKNGSKKKEIRIEFSDKQHFMAIPLRTNWLWHHFPQQYDSRIERALDWARAQVKEEKKQSVRDSRRSRNEQQQPQ
ncbi:hypothetical protein BGZ96_000572 [Linnemannia gamsii]|uniref:sn-1-specific diacylglycerol lipase n=1 Tax=Linnemannia gamsii TaxID=64522 RepID=A0ABQ7JNS5_9FUNG|nr:hypothetical protein BGZ96_000572 [Linnemannia gamsii]